MGRPPRADGRNARTVANNKYNEKAYDRINLVVPKGGKEKIANHAAQMGESVSGFINGLIAASVPDFTPLKGKQN